MSLHLLRVSEVASGPRVPTASDLNWLRAGVLGANDGIVSIAATVLGVAAATSQVSALAIAGVAALVAGALSMAAGEYVSVSSQRDAEVIAARAHVAAHPDDTATLHLTNPWHAALASLTAFTLGGLVPLLVVLAPWGTGRVLATFVAVIVALALTGWISAVFAGTSVPRPVLRNLVGGTAAMAITYGIGTLVGQFV